MQLAFVLWFKKHKRCWPNFTALAAKTRTRIATLMCGLIVSSKGSPMIHASSNTDLPRGA